MVFFHLVWSGEGCLARQRRLLRRHFLAPRWHFCSMFDRHFSRDTQRELLPAGHWSSETADYILLLCSALLSPTTFQLKLRTGKLFFTSFCCLHCSSHATPAYIHLPPFFFAEINTNSRTVYKTTDKGWRERERERAALSLGSERNEIAQCASVHPPRR